VFFFFLNDFKSSFFAARLLPFLGKIQPAFDSG